MISVEWATFSITYYFKISLKREIQTMVTWMLEDGADMWWAKLIDNINDVNEINQ